MRRTLLPTLALFTVSLGYGVIMPLLPQLTGSTEVASAGSLSLVYAAYALAKIVTQFPAGVWVDRRGGVQVLRAALVLFVLSLVGFLYDGGPVWFAVVRALEGGATGLVYPAVFALVLQSGGEHGSGKRIGLAVGLGTSGLLIGPVLAGLLAPFGLQVPVLVAIGLTAGLALWAFVWHPAPTPVERPRTLASEVRNLATVAGTAGFLGLCVPIAFNKLTFSAFQGLLPLHGAAVLGLGTPGVTALFALTGVVFGVFQGVGGVLADRGAPRRWVTLLGPLLAGSMALVAMSQQPITFALSYGASIALSSTIFTATLRATAKWYGTEQSYGGVFGVLGTVTDTMTVVGPLLFVGLYPRLGAGVFWLMAALGVVAAVLFAAATRAASPRASTTPESAS